MLKLNIILNSLPLFVSICVFVNGDVLNDIKEATKLAQQPILRALTQPSEIAVQSIMDIVSPNQTKPENGTVQNKHENPPTPIIFGSDLVKDVIKTSLNMVPMGSVALGDTAVVLINATDTTSKLITKLSGLTPTPEKERVYYNTIPADEETWRKPKFFSTKCTFRMACEFGRMMIKPYSTDQINFVVERSKLIHDLHNRYTRAATYGLLHGECSRYYCVAIEFFGGPVQVAGAIAELTNRVVNPDLYE